LQTRCAGGKLLSIGSQRERERERERDRERSQEQDISFKGIASVIYFFQPVHNTYFQHVPIISPDYAFIHGLIIMSEPL
jgi:hypothetical protein